MLSAPASPHRRTGHTQTPVLCLSGWRGEGALAIPKDPAGNRTSEQIDNGVVSASHNNLNQTTSTQPGGMLRLAGTTNEAANVTVGGLPARILDGNRFEGETPVGSGTTAVPVVATDGSGNARTYTYNVSVSGSTKTLTYDPNGNLLADGTKTYEWDSLNHLTRVLEGTTELARFVYDGSGRRVQKIAGGVTRTFVYDEAYHVAEERLSTGETIRYFRGQGTDEWLAKQDSAGVTYFIQDHLGSVVANTDLSGNATLRRTYDPWGNMDAVSASQGGSAFTGRDWDPEVGLYNYRARACSPSLGRFVSEDPTGFRGGTNFYSYVFNRPTRLTDPSGLEVKRCFFANSPDEPQWDMLRHEVVCVYRDGKWTCSGQQPAGGRRTKWNVVLPVDGVPDDRPRSQIPINTPACSTVRGSGNNCFEECVRVKLTSRVRPRYAGGPCGKDCQEWAEYDVIAQCYFDCKLPPTPEPAPPPPPFPPPGQ